MLTKHSPQMTAEWETVDIIWAQLMSHQPVFRVKNGTFKLLIHTFNLRMFFRKCKTLKTIAVMPVARNRIHGVTQ